jgi:glycine hydroxymethyltransferase
MCHKYQRSYEDKGKAKDMQITTKNTHDGFNQALELSDPELLTILQSEQKRQSDNIELIASENFASPAVRAAQGSILTNKYAEGYPEKRWYGGCEHVDRIEALAISRGKELFGAEHINVQPHSGSQANAAVYLALLNPGDYMLTMDLAHGGHLTHGHKANFSGKLYRAIHYGVEPESEQLDYAQIEKLADKVRPAMLTAGASAYSRIIDFERLRYIADRVGALFLVDMAHISGLVAAGIHPSPVPHAHVVTSTTHKSLRGPRGGIILCQGEFAKKIDACVFPGVQGGPLMHVIAAKAICFMEAQKNSFQVYARQVVENAQALAKQLQSHGHRIVSGGTDNHLLLVDLRPQKMSGKKAQELLDLAGITVNKNVIPFDTEPIYQTGGIRLGTPAMTTRGLGINEMRQVADFIHEVLTNPQDYPRLNNTRKRVREFLQAFPLP